MPKRGEGTVPQRPGRTTRGQRGAKALHLFNIGQKKAVSRSTRLAILHASGGLALVAVIFFSAFMVRAQALTPGDLIKGSDSTVYFYSGNGTRHAFPNENVFYSWFLNFFGVKNRSDAELLAIPKGPDVPYRSGTRLIKTPDNPKVYAIEGRSLRWIKTEELARDIFGDAWNDRIDDMSANLMKGYVVGNEISQIVDYIPAAVYMRFPSIASIFSTPAPVSEPEPLPVPPEAASGPSDTVSPTMPQDLKVNPLTDQSTFLVWNPSSDNVGTTGYAIFRNGVQVGEAVENRFTDTGLVPGMSYMYTVSAHDAAGNVSARTPPTSVAMPTTPSRRGTKASPITLLQDLYDGRGGGGTNAFSTSAFTPVSGGRLVAIVASMESNGTSAFSDDFTITDSQGLTWTPIGDVGNTSSWAIGMRAWISSPVTASNMTVTFDCGAFSMEDYQAAVFEVGESDGTIAGYVEDSSTATNNATSVTLAEAATTDDLVVYARHFDNNGSPTLDMENGWSVLANVINTGGGGALGVAIHEALSGTSVVIDDIASGADGQLKGIDFAFIIKKAD